MNLLSRDRNFDITNHYDIKETIGSGGFGKVKRATHIPTGETVAIKIMDKQGLGEDLPRVKTEIEAMKCLSHHHICKLYQVHETAHKIYMVLEYCSGGELFDFIVQRDKLPEHEARAFFRQIVSAVAYMHMKGFVHRDLKPENLLIDEDQNVKVIDFGLCARPKGGVNNKLETCCGSPAYAAPELVSGQIYVGSAADVWSMGVLLYVLLNGFLPFEDSCLSTLFKKISIGKYRISRWLSPESVYLLSRLLQVNERNRISVDELRNCSWIKKDIGFPVEYDSKHPSPDVFDNDVITELSVNMGVSRGKMEAYLREWRYDYLTAAYFLLLKRKQNNKAVRLRTTLDNEPKTIVFAERSKATGFFAPSPTMVKRTPRQPLLATTHRENVKHVLVTPEKAGGAKRKNYYKRSGDNHQHQVPTHHHHHHHHHHRHHRDHRDSGNQSGDDLLIAQSSRGRHDVKNRVVAREDQLPNQNLAYTRRRTKSVDNNLQQKENFAIPRTPHISKQQKRNKVVVPTATEKVEKTFHYTKPIYNGNKGKTTNDLSVTITPPQQQGLMDEVESSLDDDNSLGSPTMQRHLMPFKRGDHCRKSLDLDMLKFSDTNDPLSPDKKSWSVDDTLHSPDISNHLQRQQQTSGKHRSRGGGMFGSFERGLDRFKTLLTPSKRRNASDCEPRKIKDSCNVSNISRRDPMELLRVLRNAIGKENNVETKEKGYVIRCEIFDGYSNKSKLSFKFEICSISNSSSSSAPNANFGIRRKRLKGDALKYKRICESIINSVDSSLKNTKLFN